MKPYSKILSIFLILSIYGAFILSFKGKLSNQTAIIIDVKNDAIFLMAVNETQFSLSRTIPLEASQWRGEGKNFAVINKNGTLVITSVINYTKKFIFNATVDGLSLNFSEFPFLHTVISSRPDVAINFLVGTSLLDSSRKKLEDQLLITHEVASTDGAFVWINCSSQKGEYFDKHNDHPVTINVGEIISEIGLTKKIFSALMIKVKYAGFKPEANNTCFIQIKSLCLMKELPYYLDTDETKCHSLLDGSIVHVIKRYDKFIRTTAAYPYLQRVYIRYSIDALQNALYKIFLVSKNNNNLTASQSIFLFCHSSRLNEVGTHVDWKQMIMLNRNFDPIGGLYSLMNNGDYAIIFAPVNRSELKNIELYTVEFTFSKTPHTRLVMPTLSEQILLAANLFILIIAGILPTLLLLTTLYMYKNGILRNSKKMITKMFAGGLALRLLLAPITAFTNDLQIFAQLGSLYFGTGILGAQWVSLPGFVYIQIATYFPYALLRAIGFQDFQFLGLSIYVVEALFTKIPSILGDLGIVLYLRKFSQKYMPQKEALLVGAYMLNPLTIYISGILGQFDTIFVFFIILCTYHLTVEYDKVKASISSSLAMMINPVGSAMFILFLAKVKERENFSAIVKVLLLAISLFCVLMLPFFFEPKSPVLLTSYERFLSGIPGEAFYGKQFNFYLYGSIISYSVGYGLTFRFLLEILGYELSSFFYPYGTLVAFFVTAMIFMYLMYKAKTNAHRNLLIGTFMLVVTIIFQLTFPTIFDQFVIWIAGLLLVAYLLSTKKYFLLIFMVISIAMGFIYVAIWRNYLLLISGLEKAPLADPYLSNIASALLGVLYSALLIIILIAIFRLWLKRSLRG